MPHVVEPQPIIPKVPDSEIQSDAPTFESLYSIDLNPNFDWVLDPYAPVPEDSNKR